MIRDRRCTEHVLCRMLISPDSCGHSRNAYPRDYWTELSQYGVFTTLLAYTRIDSNDMYKCSGNYRVYRSLYNGMPMDHRLCTSFMIENLCFLASATFAGAVQRPFHQVTLCCHSNLGHHHRRCQQMSDRHAHLTVCQSSAMKKIPPCTSYLFSHRHLALLLPSATAAVCSPPIIVPKACSFILAVAHLQKPLSQSLAQGVSL